jgi:hypothetical protein
MKITRSLKHLFHPVHLFAAICIAAAVWLLPQTLNPSMEVQAAPAEIPGCRRVCVESNAWGRCLDAIFICPPVVNDSPPAITGSLNCAQPGANGWCAGGLQLDLTAADPQQYLVNISGDIGGASFACPDGDTQCSQPVTVQSAGSASYTVLSDSGLSASGSIAYKLDTTPPQITQSVSGTSGANGWYTTLATLTASANDPVSGLGSFVIQDNGVNITSPASLGNGIHSITLTAVDNAGNTATSTLSIKVDTSAPTISISIPAPPASGWHTEAPVLSVSGVDAGSGIASLSILDNGVSISNPATLGDGIHAIVITVTNLAGTSTSNAFTVKVDTTPPVIAPAFTGTVGQHGWYVSAVGVDANFTDATSGISSTTVLADGNVISLPDVLTIDGEYTLIFNARDVADNLASQSINIGIDRTAPVITVSRNGTLGDHGWYRSDVDFQITVTDAMSGPQYGEYRIDGSTWVSTGSTTGEMNFTVSGDGTHTVEYRVFDQAGNVASQSETIQIDTADPSVSFTAPSQDTPVDKITKVSGTSSDVTSGLNIVEVSVDNGSSWIPVSNGAWAYDWKVSTVANGSHPILARARDVAGNVSSASNLNLLVDNIGPSISMSAPWSFDEAGELVVTPNAYSVRSVSISVTNSAGEVMTSSQHTGGEIPSILWWDGRHNGQQQPAGEYAVSVTACDVHGVCSMGSSAITIPEFYYTFHEPPTYPPLVVSTAPPIIVPTSGPVLMPEPIHTPDAPVPSPVTKRTGAELLFFVSAGFGLLFFNGAVFDPRPRAMRSLAVTLRRNIRE